MRKVDSSSFQRGSAPPSNLKTVHFAFKHPTASKVLVAGSFNDWHPEGNELHSSGNGYWWRNTQLPPGKYEYRLIVDGEWMEDPHALNSVPNPFGGRNSILTVVDLNQF